MVSRSLTSAASAVSNPAGTRGREPMSRRHGLWTFLLLGVCPLRATQDSSETTPAPLEIRLNEQADWGCPLEDARRVCAAAAGELWRYFPGRRLPPIQVDPRGGPIVLFNRSPRGEIRVRLDVHGTYWAQMTYQFSHEFCHILCNYRDNPNPNKWFEEAVCETASLFVLRRSAETWKSRPPYPNWKDYAGALGRYAEERIEKARLPAGTTLAAWYRTHAETLARNPTNRDLNTTAATELLSLFEESPGHWEAVGALNSGDFDALTTFRQYLESWLRHAGEPHETFIRRLASKFEISLPSPQRTRLKTTLR